MSMAGRSEMSRSRSLARGVRGLCLAVVAAGGHVAALQAQEMEIPVATHLPLFLKVLSFDRRHEPRAGRDEPFVLGIVYQSRNRVSLTAKNEVMRVVASMNASSTQLRALEIDLDAESLDSAIVRTRADVIYVAPLRALDIADVARATRAASVTTLTGVPEYVPLGLAVSVRLQGERPKLLVNLPASRLEGADFSAELLKLAQVVQ
jgi:hypothetical protein